VNRLKGKTAIITGAGLGIGHAAALRMAEEGASIAALDMLDKEGRAFADDLKSRGHNAKFFPVTSRKKPMSPAP